MTHRTGRYQEGAYNRQQVLDYLHDNPGATAIEILAAVRIGKTNGATLLRRMSDMGELSRVKALYKTPDGHRITYAYTALVRETRNADTVREIIAANVNGHKPKKTPKWVTRNTDPERPVTPNPDAMRGVGYRGMTQLEAMA